MFESTIAVIALSVFGFYCILGICHACTTPERQSPPTRDYSFGHMGSNEYSVSTSASSE